MAAVQNALAPVRPTTVVIADVSQMDCQLLVDTIDRHKHFEVLSCTTSSTEAVSAVRENHPDVVLLSIRLEDGAFAGLFVLRQLQALRLPSRVIALLDDDEPELVVKAFREGARGIFCRTGAAPELRECIKRVRGGKVWASNTHWEWIVAALAQSPVAKSNKIQMTKVLSTREVEVARLVAAALSNRELSQRLGISEHTVKNYLSRIFEKLGISTRTELVLYVLSQAKPATAHQNNKSSLAAQGRSA
jgi:two-component system, NarL family, nitrate/nitrite response regulator NarL